MPSNMSLPAHRSGLSREDSSRGFNKRGSNGGRSGNENLLIFGALCLAAAGGLVYIYSSRSNTTAASSSLNSLPHPLPHGSTGRGVPIVKAAPPAAVAVVPEPDALPLPPPPVTTPQQQQPLALQVAREPLRKRNILLYTADTRINTGVWPNWGGDPPVESTLNWAAAGTIVKKSCPLPCAFYHDDNKMSIADVVIVEGVNWPKFGFAGKELPLPERTRVNPQATTPGAPPTLPLLGYFGYEPSSYFPQYSLSNKDIAKHFTFSMIPSDMTPPLPFSLPITLLCPWGHAVSDFLKPPPEKQDTSRIVAYFSEHGVAPAFRDMLDQFFTAAGDKIHAYIHKKNKDMPAEAGGEPYALKSRISFMGTYKFLLITEAVDEPDFLSAEWSQAILGGTVPVYLGGPPNLASFALPGSYIDARTFASGSALWEYLSSFAGASPEAEIAYARFFAWKAGATKAHAIDGPDIDALGTGAGVTSDACSPDNVRDVAQWPNPVVPGSMPASEAGIDVVAAAGWRCFRRGLDRCVHYSECRACTLAHSLT